MTKFDSGTIARHSRGTGPGGPQDHAVTTRKPVNREVYEGADLIALRLRSAKKPAVIPFLEIPPEEIDLEPVTLEPMSLTDAEPIPIMPLVVPMSEILPFDDEDVPEITPAVASDPADGAAAASSVPAPTRDGKTPTSAPTASPSDGLSLFGVGTILDEKPRGKGRGR